MLMTDPDRACYGFQVVQYAAYQDAIDVLMLSDALFFDDFKQRRVLDALVAYVKSHGGEVLRFSQMHSSGEKLMSLTGIAAILRYPFPDIDLLAETDALKTST
jgi:protein pelota